jgi:excisionase family DNA binding protein
MHNASRVIDRPMLKVSEVAERLCCSVANAYALIESGQLPHFRIGARRCGIRVTEGQIQEFLESSKRGPRDRVKISRPRLKHIKLMPAPSTR